MPKGSTLESLFDELDERAEFEALARKKILAERFRGRMEELHLSKSELAKRLSTSRKQLDRILDPADKGVTLSSLFKISEVLGLNLTLSAERKSSRKSHKSRRAA